MARPGSSILRRPVTSLVASTLTPSKTRPSDEPLTATRCTAKVNSYVPRLALFLLFADQPNLTRPTMLHLSICDVDVGQSYTKRQGNVVVALELARRYGDQGIVSTSLNPGNIKTDLQRYLPGFVQAIFVRFRLVYWMAHRDTDARCDRGV